MSAILPVASADARTSFGARTLHQGMHGHDVRVLQDYLTRAGHQTPVDGRFGVATVEHVRAWERAAGRPEDGIVTRVTARALRRHVRQLTAGGAQYVEEPKVAPPTTSDPAASKPATSRATLLPDGTAVAPADAPEAVKAIIASGNEIAHDPYRYGGGHGRWKDTGYDCSGSVSYALHGAGLLDKPLDSSGFESWAGAGQGAWVTTYANSGHMFMEVAGLRYDTSGFKADGTRWHSSRRSHRGYVARHYEGL